ncbi:MAG: Methyltransferase type 12 [Gemmatimonadetes bacterium]|nr:Methyltransferase type 12 [Gemmatimonadota bacterium]
MTGADALALLRAAIPSAEGETWADLGAGGGVFTRALASLVGAGGRVYAVDSDAASIARLRASITGGSAAAVVDMLHADVTQPLGLPPLDGVVMANVLHFVRDAGEVLTRIVSQLRPGGRVVVIEYEGRRPTRWVPSPLPAERLASLAATAGLTMPHVVATRPSAFGGRLYVATSVRHR